MVVVSSAGHDIRKVYLVMSLSEKLARIADGRSRKYSNPKVKRVTHLKALGLALQPDELILLMEAMHSEEEKNTFIRDKISEFLDKQS